MNITQKKRGSRYADFKKTHQKPINDSSLERGKSGIPQRIDDFILHLKAADRASSTISCYMKSLEWLAEVLEDTGLEGISDRHIEKAIITLQDSCTTGQRRSSATMNRIKSAFKSFFKWAYQAGLTSRNPAAGLRISKAASQRTIPITMEEIKALLQTISESEDPNAERDEALFATYAFTGIRCAEALALRIKDYDQSSLTLYLPKVKRTNGRLQPIPNRLSRILERWISILRCNSQADSSSFLFHGRHPERSLTTRQVRFRFNRWKALSGIREELTVHSFRAGFATHLYRATGDSLLVQHAIGHSDIRTTERYIGNNLFEIRQAIEKGFC